MVVYTPLRNKFDNLQGVVELLVVLIFFPFNGDAAADPETPARLVVVFAVRSFYY